MCWRASPAPSAWRYNQLDVSISGGGANAAAGASSSGTASVSATATPSGYTTTPYDTPSVSYSWSHLSGTVLSVNNTGISNPTFSYGFSGVANGTTSGAVAATYRCFITDNNSGAQAYADVVIGNLTWQNTIPAFSGQTDKFTSGSGTCNRPTGANTVTIYAIAWGGQGGAGHNGGDLEHFGGGGGGGGGRMVWSVLQRPATVTIPEAYSAQRPSAASVMQTPARPGTALAAAAQALAALAVAQLAAMSPMTLAAQAQAATGSGGGGGGGSGQGGPDGTYGTGGDGGSDIGGGTFPHNGRDLLRVGAMSQLIMLTPHFSLREATATLTGLPNIPSPAQLARLRWSAGYMELVREILCHPIDVSSAFRTPEVNKASDGSKTSAHMLGEAWDFKCPGYGTLSRVADCLRSSGIQFDQLILEPSWVHIGFSKPMRQQCLTRRRNSNLSRGDRMKNHIAVIALFATLFITGCTAGGLVDREGPPVKDTMPQAEEQCRAQPWLAWCKP